MKSREHAELLLRKAAQDEYLLDAMLNDPHAPLEAFGFHAQQTVEKLLKASLAAQRVVYPRTHRLTQLLDLARDSGVPLPSRFDEVRLLTPYAVEFRYDALPEENEESIDKTEVRRQLRDLRAWVESFVQAST